MDFGVTLDFAFVVVTVSAGSSVVVCWAFDAEAVASNASVEAATNVAGRIETGFGRAETCGRLEAHILEIPHWI